VDFVPWVDEFEDGEMDCELEEDDVEGEDEEKG
jgi:hypothetical protein